MKKLLSVLLLVALVISLATTALADTVVDAETDAKYRQAVLATLPQFGVQITKPTENFFVMKAPLSDKTVLTIETDSETPIKGWHCYLYNYNNSLVASPFLAVTYGDSEWVIDSISASSSYIKKVGVNTMNLSLIHI